MKSSTTEGDGDVKQRRRETSNANLLGDGHTHTHTCACTHVHACGFRCPKSESVNMTRNTELQKERFGDGDTKPLWPTPAPHAVTTAQAKKKKALALPRMKHAAKLTTHPTNFASTFRDEREMKACVYDVVHPLPSPPSLSPRASLCQHPPPRPSSFTQTRAQTDTRNGTTTAMETDEERWSEEGRESRKRVGHGHNVRERL